MINIAPPYKKFNEYEIRGNTTAIFVYNRFKEMVEVLIDTEDLQKLIDLNYHWHLRYCTHTGLYYVKATGNKLNNGKKSIYLQVVIMESKFENNKESVDHYNHNTLDNRKENLRIVQIGENTKHRKSKNSNNKSGYRNICKVNNKWIVQLQVDGKNKVLGRFLELDEAVKFAEVMRNEIYGDYAGNA